MKLKVLACGVFEPELRFLVPKSPHEIDLVLLDAGLHETPRELRRAAQEAIDSAEGYDAVVVVYGLCGRGTAGLLAHNVPVVLPRVHDCLTLFLGSREEYRRQFSQNPGTFYITAGWYEHKVAPRGQAPSEGLRGDRVEEEPRYRQWAAKYGDDNARAILQFYDSWKHNYSRAAFIDTGLGDRETYAAYARDMAREFGWSYEVLRGHTEVLEALLNGDWDRPDVLVLQPGERSVATGDEQVLGAVQRGSADVMELADAGNPLAPADSAPTPPGTLGLGIDSGGTFTDCVLMDLGTGEVLAKAKAQTTHYDLLVGIDEALGKLEMEEPGAITMVALSTTLATNAIAEGKGGLIGAILMTVDGKPDPHVSWQPQRVLGASMDIGGSERRPLDLREAERAIDELLLAGVEAFAISGYASVRNPAHELAVRDLVRERCDLPVVCGHELSSKLNYVHRANTAILNARLLPTIRHLIDAARKVLRRHGVTAPLMIVKGDGSLISEATALERPVETVLSGPAASVAGARYLTGEADCLVMDMGGTTTDTAVVEQGLVRISDEGARVNGWQTSVAAADIQTSGLGGDSYVQFDAERRLRIGPWRVVPLCYLAHAHPIAAEQIMSLNAEHQVDRSSARLLDFYALGRSAQEAELSDTEAWMLEALAKGPLSADALAARLGLTSHLLLRTARLEALGYIQRSGLTPTDVLHARGEYRAWDVEAARHALSVFADLYGCPADEMGERILEEVVRRLCLEALRRELGDKILEGPWATREGGNGLAREIIDAALDGRSLGPLSLRLQYTRPIVAIGAPVRAFFSQVGQRLDANVLIPPHAEVANAIGAVVSEVVVREQAVVRPGEVANYVLHWREGRREFESLGEALLEARRVLHELASRTALSAGAERVRVRVDVNERWGYLATGEQELIEVRLEATAAGRPSALAHATG